MRVIFAFIGVIGAIFYSPWVPLVCMVLLAFRYPSWEVLILGLFMDFLWLPTGFIYPLPIFTIVSIILVWGLEPLRREFLFS